MANTSNTKKTGGLVLKRAELAPILHEKDTVGLAFAVETAGQASNVDLIVLRVYEQGGQLYGEERAIRHKQGAASPMQYPASSIDDYQFRFLDKLGEDQFVFGFFTKDAFEQLFEVGWDEIFVGGGKKNYGEIDLFDKEEWFTLTIAVRRGIKSIVLANGKMSENRGLKDRSISLGKLANQDAIGIDTLRKVEPELFGLDRTVSSIILDKETTQVKGINLKVDEGVQSLMFDEPSQVRTVLLTRDGTLKRIYLNEQGDEESSQEEEMLLGNLFFGQMEPCPPYWPDGNGKQRADAVLEALEHV